MRKKNVCKAMLVERGDKKRLLSHVSGARRGKKKFVKSC